MRDTWGLRGPRPRARGPAPWTHPCDEGYAIKTACFRMPGLHLQASSRAKGNNRADRKNERARFRSALLFPPVRFAHRPRGFTAPPGSGGSPLRFLLRLRLIRRKMLPSLVLSSAPKRERPRPCLLWFSRPLQRGTPRSVPPHSVIFPARCKYRRECGSSSRNPQKPDAPGSNRRDTG